MEIQGSTDFVDQVQAALHQWQSVDPDAFATVKDTITAIHEVQDGFCARTQPDKTIEVCRNVAFWPKEEAKTQQDILATFLAHEGWHTWARNCGSTEWNTSTGEVQAMQYQKCVASALGIPEQFIVSPEMPDQAPSKISPLLWLLGLGAAFFGLRYARAARK